MGIGDRRSFLAGSLCASLCGVLGKPAPAHAALRAPPNAAVPRFWVFICMFGGIDAILTTDPKRPDEVERNIDVPYRPRDIVEPHGVRLGPHFADLGSRLPDLAIVNGVRVRNANHPTGVQNHMRMKDGANERAPSLFELLGTARSEAQPLSCVSLGTFFGAQQYTPQYFGVPNPYVGGRGKHLFERSDALDLDEAALLGNVMRDHARTLERAGDTHSAESARQAAGFFQRLSEVPRFAPESWPGDDATPEARHHMAGYLKRALWLLENDFSHTVHLQVGGGQGWDTHQNNLRRQKAMSAAFVPLFGRFIDELKTRRTSDGRTLWEQTAIVASSELGRNPGLNPFMGKDHFPQIPMLFGGPWFNTHGDGKGSYGATGPNMAGAPVSLKDGRAARGGALLKIDDVGTTLLTMAGLSPDTYGYAGRFLDFLVKA